MINDQNVLVVTSVDEPTYRIYSRLAAALHADPPALMQHVLSGVAPTLAAAASYTEQEGTMPVPLHLYAALVQGDIVLGGESRCTLTAEAVRVQERVTQTLARTAELLERSAATYARAQDAMARTRHQQSAAPLPLS